MKATIFDIVRNSYVDGPGIRTTVFFKGCNLHCIWCHNPESQSPKAELLFYSNRCSGCGRCKEKCPYSLKKCDLCGSCSLYCPQDAREICGKEYTAADIMKEILKDKTFYENSGGGVTFSGGECMLQIDFLEEILKECKNNGIHTAIDTAGHVPYEYFKRVLPYTDLFLYDIKCFDNEKHKKFTGVKNELILKNLKMLIEDGGAVNIRIPIIPDINDSIEEMRAIRDFLSACNYRESVELLPYHAMGEHKYAAIGRQAQSFSIPDKEKIAILKEVFL